MPSFDVVSEVDMHELTNAVDQANREVATRFDFKGSDAKFEQSGNEIILSGTGEFQLQQMMDILQKKMLKRGVEISSLEVGKTITTNMVARKKATVRQGIDKETAKKIVKLIKEGKLKVQASIQEDQVRVTGKNRDDLQAVMAMLKEQQIGLPLQYTNFRD